MPFRRATCRLPPPAQDRSKWQNELVLEANAVHESSDNLPARRCNLPMNNHPTNPRNRLIN
jgi:hypothetical protein